MRFSVKNVNKIICYKKIRVKSYVRYRRVQPVCCVGKGIMLTKMGNAKFFLRDVHQPSFKKEKQLAQDAKLNTFQTVKVLVPDQKLPSHSASNTKIEYAKNVLKAIN